MAKLVIFLILAAIFCTFVCAQNDNGEYKIQIVPFRGVREAKADLGLNLKEEQVKPELIRLVREANADPHRKGYYEPHHKGYYYKGHNKGWKGKGHNDHKEH